MRGLLAFIFTVFAASVAHGQADSCSAIFIPEKQALIMIDRAARETSAWTAAEASRLGLSENERATIFDLLTKQVPVLDDPELISSFYHVRWFKLKSTEGRGDLLQLTEKILKKSRDPEEVPDSLQDMKMEFAQRLLAYMNAAESRGTPHNTPVGQLVYSGARLPQYWRPIFHQALTYTWKSNARTKFAELVLAQNAYRFARALHQQTPRPQAGESLIDQKVAFAIGEHASVETNAASFKPEQQFGLIPYDDDVRAEWATERLRYVEKFVPESKRKSLDAMIDTDWEEKAVVALRANQSAVGAANSLRDAIDAYASEQTRDTSITLQSSERWFAETIFAHFSFTSVHQPAEQEYLKLRLAERSKDLVYRIANPKGVRSIETRPVVETFNDERANALIDQASAAQLEDIRRLREQSLISGERLGLSREEVETTLATFATSGLIGGELQLFALILDQDLPQRNVQDVLSRASKSDFKRAFAPYFAKNADLNSEAKRMVIRITGYVEKGAGNATVETKMALRDPRKQAILALWYRASMLHIMKGLIAVSPGKIRNGAILTAKATSKLSTLGALLAWSTSFGTVIDAHMSIATTLDLIGGGAYAAALQFGYIPSEPFAQWLSERDLRLKAAKLGVAASLRDLANPPLIPQKEKAPLPKLGKFDWKQPLSDLTIPLRIKENEYNIYSYDYSRREGLQLMLVGTTPLTALAVDIADVQFSRYEQIRATIRDLKTPRKRQMAMFEQASQMLLEHMHREELEIEYSISVLDDMAKEMRLAQTYATKVAPNLVPQFEHFAAKAESDAATLRQRLDSEKPEADSEHGELMKRLAPPRR